MNNANLTVATSLVCVLTLGLPLAAQRLPEMVTTRNASSPETAASGSSVYVVGSDGGDIYLNRSLDGGATWSSDIRIDTGVGAWNGVSGEVQIAAADDAVYVLWTDTRSGQADVYFNRSEDRGETWLPSDMRLDVGSVAGMSSSSSARLAAQGDTVFAAWLDTRSGSTEVFFTHSLDAGSTWSADERVNAGAAPGAKDLELAASGAEVYVVWSDDRNWSAADIFLNRSADSGTTWESTDTQLDAAPPAFPVESYEPALAVSGSSIHVVWFEDEEIHYNRSVDGGDSWSGPEYLVWEHGGSRVQAKAPAQLEADGSSVYMTWLHAQPTIPDPFFIRSIDGGLSWEPEVRLNTSTWPGNWPNYDLRLAVADSSLCAVWNGPNGLAFNRSLDGGATWLPADLVLDASSSGFGPCIAASGDRMYVAYFDGADIRFTIPYGFLVYGAGTAGTAGRVLQLTAAGPATLGSNNTLDVAEGLAGASGVLFIGNAKASTPLYGGWGSLLVSSTWQVPVTLDSVSATGAGAMSLPLAIPDYAPFVGLGLFFQVVLVDSGSPVGFTLSNGVELWIG